jgi:hypothetical protein
MVPPESLPGLFLGSVPESSPAVAVELGELEQPAKVTTRDAPRASIVRGRRNARVSMVSLQGETLQAVDHRR